MKETSKRDPKKGQIVRDSILELSDVDFGHGTAELESHLKEYFLETESYQRVFDGRRSIVIGRKGTGKTALAKYFSENENPSFQYVVRIEASHSTYVKVDENLRSYTSQIKNLDSSFKMGWLFTAVLSLVERLSHEKRMYVTKDERNLYKFAKAHYMYTADDPISSIAGYVFNWIRHLKSVGPVTREGYQMEQNVIFDEPRLLKLLTSAIERINNQGRTVFLFFDKLDERWDGSELYISFLQGLLLAIKDIKATGLNVRPVILLRDDIFDDVTKTFQHIDHYRMEIERIKWDEESLLELIALRIRKSLELRGNRVPFQETKDIWRMVFPQDIPARRSPIAPYAYIVERTLMRPRDIILFCTHAKDVAVDRKHKQVLANDLVEGEQTYSEIKLKDLSAEYSYKLHHIDKLFNKFKRKKSGYGIDEIRLALIGYIDELSGELDWLPHDEDYLLQLLYVIGFISYTVRGGVWRGTRVIHSAIEPDPEVVLDQKRVYISPIFRKALDTKDR